MSLKCNHCDIIYEKTKHRIKTEIQRVNLNYCSTICSSKAHTKPIVLDNCNFCDKQFIRVKHHNTTKKFCSAVCSNKHRGPRTEEEKRKISESIKRNPKTYDPIITKKGQRRKSYISFTCPICASISEVTPSNKRKTCGVKSCVKEYRSKISKVGGYKKGSARSKCGYFQGHYCDSTYELVWVMYNLEHSIQFTRFKDKIPYIDDEGVSRNYHPDFISNGKVIEIKGFHTKLVDIKTQAARDAGYDIDVLYKKDIQYMFDWFIEKYPEKKLEDMYEKAHD